MLYKYLIKRKHDLYDKLIEEGYSPELALKVSRLQFDIDVLGCSEEEINSDRLVKLEYIRLCGPQIKVK